MAAWQATNPKSIDRAQASWRAYEEAECGFEDALFITGYGRGAAEALCEIALDADRTGELHALVMPHAH